MDSIDSIVRVFSEIVGSASSSIRRMLYRGLVRARERGDLMIIGHYLSMLSPSYYGEDLPYEFDGYFKSYPGRRKISLPKPMAESGADVFRVIASRRSRRRYSRSPITLAELSTILYYTVGVTGRAWWGGPKRVYPSAGALQPVEAYLSASKVEELEPGIYHYNPGGHYLEELKLGDYSRILEDIALGQEHLGEAPLNIILTIVYKRTASKYGLRAYRYAHLDAGFAGENIYITVEALNLATVAVGAFYDEELCKLLEIDCEEEIPVLIFPIGRRI